MLDPAQHALGFLSLRLLLTVSPGWALTETPSQTPAPELRAAKFRPSGLVCFCAHASGLLVTLPVEPECKTEGGSGLCPFGSRLLFCTPVAAVRHKMWNEKTKTRKDIPAGQAPRQMSIAHPVSLVLVFWRQGPGP